MQPSNKPGWGWLLWNHAWLLWTFTLLFGWGSFLHAGLAARRWRWVAYGAAYGALSLPLFLLAGTVPESAMNDTLAVLAFGAGIVSGVHAWSIRAEYLVRIRLIERANMQRLEQETGVDLDGDGLIGTWRIEEPGAAGPQTAGRVDVNNAPAEVLAGLPGVGVMGAEIALRLRREMGGFKTGEDFVVGMGLPDTLAAQVRPLITLEPPRPETIAGWKRD